MSELAENLTLPEFEVGNPNWNTLLEAGEQNLTLIRIDE